MSNNTIHGVRFKLARRRLVTGIVFLVILVIYWPHLIMNPDLFARNLPHYGRAALLGTILNDADPTIRVVIMVVMEMLYLALLVIQVSKLWSKAIIVYDGRRLCGLNFFGISKSLNISDVVDFKRGPGEIVAITRADRISIPCHDLDMQVDQVDELCRLLERNKTINRMYGSGSAR